MKIHTTTTTTTTTANEDPHNNKQQQAATTSNKPKQQSHVDSPTHAVSTQTQLHSPRPLVAPPSAASPSPCSAAAPPHVLRSILFQLPHTPSYPPRVPYHKATNLLGRNHMVYNPALYVYIVCAPHGPRCGTLQTGLHNLW